MNNKFEIDDTIIDAIQTIQNFVGEISGKAPTQKEIAASLKKYFILKEIMDQIIWDRDHPENKNGQ